MLTKLFTWLKQDTIRRTFGYYSLFICLGLGTAMVGPTLPSLAKQTGASLGQIGLLFLAGSIGATLGTFVGGRIFDRARGHPVLGLFQLFAAALIIFIPFAPWLWLLILIMVCKGFADGIVNTGANTLLVWTHGEKAGPFMNALHFFFGLGAFLSPLLVAQVVNIEGGYRWAYWALAAFAALVGLRMLTLPGSPALVHAPASETPRPARSLIPYAFVISAALFLFFYVGAEISFGGWIYTYALALGLATATGAAYMTSGFWLAFTIGRLISIPAATRFKPTKIIPTAALSCLSILALVILMPGSRTILWIVALGLGFCMAPIWPTGFTLAGQSIALTGLVSSLILLGDSFGGMILPSLIGRVIEAAGPRTMVYLIFGSLVLNLLAFTGMLRLRSIKNAP